MMNLELLFHDILSSGITSADPETIRKFKALNIFQLIFIMAAPLLGLFYLLIGATPLFYVSIAAGLLMMTGMVLLRKTKNMILGGNFAIFILWVVLFIVSWFTGAITYEGVIKPTWVLNGGLILLAIFFNGYLGGTIWSSVVFVETGVVIYLFRNGYQFPNLIPPEIAAVYSLGTYLLGLLVLLTFAFIYETEKNTALSRELKRSQSLLDSKRYMDDLLDRSPIATFALDRNHRVVQWNRSCSEMTGVSAEEILGKEIWDGLILDEMGSMADLLLEHPEYITEKYGDSIKSHTETGWYELDMVLPKIENGMRALITIGPIHDNDGMVRGAIQTIQPVEDLHQERESGMNSLLGAYGDSAASPVFKVDSRGRISYWNKACEDRFGYTSDQMIGKNALTLVAKPYQNLVRQGIVEVFQGKPIHDQEWKYGTSTGQPVYVMARAVVQLSADGEKKECIVMNTDITSLRLRINKLKLYTSETKERLKSLTEEHDMLKKNIATFIRKKET
ncbi:PAS domain-containing protein [Thermodesulfobacteriota bacterium]